MRLAPAAAFLLLIAGSSATFGCSIGSAPIRVVDGRSFPADAVSEITEGMPAEEVEKTLGLPLSVRKEDDLTIWRYFQRERKDDVIRFLGVFPVRRALAIWDTEAEIVLRDNLVERIRITEQKVK